MTTVFFLRAALAILLAGIILVRCICIVNNMDCRHKGVHAGRFFAFGLSYCCLAAGALFTMFRACDGEAVMGEWFFLVGSAGLILFDRRQSRNCRDPRKCREAIQ